MFLPSPYSNYISDLKEHTLDDLKEKFKKKEICAMNIKDVITKDSKSFRSTVWKNFMRLVDVVNNILVVNFVMCSGCDSFIHFNGKTTTGILKHEKNAKHSTLVAKVAVPMSFLSRNIYCQCLTVQ